MSLGGYSIMVPWRAGDPDRERAWEYVRTRMGKEPIPVDADPDKPFSRAASRNRAMEIAPDPIVIIHDADMLVPEDAYDDIARMCCGRRMTIGYTEYRALSRRSTRRVIDHGADPFAETPAGTTTGWSLGGIIGMRKATWNLVGGMDERFRGWGCEDTAFAHAASIVLPKTWRSPNPAVHLWHPHGTETLNPDDEAANAALLAAYNTASTIEELRAIQEER